VLAASYDLSLMLVTRKIGHHGTLPWVIVIDDAEDPTVRAVRAVDDGAL
jgi:hypothetical protein